jgi:hypothetical protein
LLTFPGKAIWLFISRFHTLDAGCVNKDIPAEGSTSLFCGKKFRAALCHFWIDFLVQVKITPSKKVDLKNPQKGISDIFLLNID